MVVRFLPVPGSESLAQPEKDRENLAEVIQLRSRLAPAEAVNDGMRLDVESVAQPAAEAQAVRTAMEDAVRMLARRARSSGELRRELSAVGHESREIDEVALECESRLYLDDLGLARVIVENLRARKRASRSQIRLKLRERLLPDGVVEEVLGELDDDEENDLLQAAASERARKMGALDRQTAERRLLGFLARRGWSGERAVRVAREALDRASLRTPSVFSSDHAAPSSNRSSVRFR